MTEGHQFLDLKRKVRFGVPRVEQSVKHCLSVLQHNLEAREVQYSTEVEDIETIPTI